MLPKIAERRTSAADDLLSRMCRAEIEGERLTDDEIRAFTSLLLVAGGETTDRALANLFMNLLDNPEQLRAVQEDRSLVDAAFAESLRHTPPVHMIMRQAEVDLDVQGVKIPEGSTLTLLLAAANRDPRKFEDPDRFDIFRPDNDVRRAFTAGADHVSFANGRHFCVGAMLSLTEVRIGTNMLLDHMQDVCYADGFRPLPEGVFTNAPNRMDLTFVPA
jgi:pulcherriminic acid synthase